MRSNRDRSGNSLVRSHPAVQRPNRNLLAESFTFARDLNSLVTLLLRSSVRVEKPSALRRRLSKWYRSFDHSTVTCDFAALAIFLARSLIGERTGKTLRSMLRPHKVRLFCKRRRQSPSTRFSVRNCSRSAAIQKDPQVDFARQ